MTLNLTIQLFLVVEIEDLRWDFLFLIRTFTWQQNSVQIAILLTTQINLILITIKDKEKNPCILTCKTLKIGLMVTRHAKNKTCYTQA